MIILTGAAMQDWARSKAGINKLLENMLLEEEHTTSSSSESDSVLYQQESSSVGPCRQDMLSRDG